MTDANQPRRQALCILSNITGADPHPATISRMRMQGRSRRRRGPMHMHMQNWMPTSHPVHTTSERRWPRIHKVKKAGAGGIIPDVKPSRMQVRGRGAAATSAAAVPPQQGPPGAGPPARPPLACRRRLPHGPPAHHSAASRRTPRPRPARAGCLEAARAGCLKAALASRLPPAAAAASAGAPPQRHRPSRDADPRARHTPGHERA